MRIIKTGLLVTAATLALAGCSKKEEAAPPAATEAAATPESSMAPATEASASTAADKNDNPIKP